MDIVLRQNGNEVGRFGLTTNKSDTQTNDVIKIVKNGTTYYGRLTSNIPNTTRKLKVIKNGSTLYLQTDPVGLRWAGTLSFTTDDGKFDSVVASNIQYPNGEYRITAVSRRGDTFVTNTQTFKVVQGGIGDFHVKQDRPSATTYDYKVWCGGFGYLNVTSVYRVTSVKVEKIG